LNQEILEKYKTLSPEDKKALRLKLSHHDYYCFGQFYLSHYFSFPTPEFHFLVYDALNRNEYKRLLVEAPVDSAKSFIIALLKPLHDMLYGLKDEILDISATSSLSEKWLGLLKEELLENKLIQSDFGDFWDWGPKTSQTWNIDEITIHKKGQKDVASRFYARGRGAQVRGYHPDLLIVDDIDDERSTSSEMNRENTERWFFSALMKRVDRIGSQVCMIGTRLHPFCMTSKIAEDEKQKWNKMKFQAIDDKGQSYWESRWPIKMLLEKRAEDPLSFEAEYMNNPTLLLADIFKRDWFNHTYDVLPNDLTKIMALDPAGSTTSKSSYSAVVVFGISASNKKIYYVEADRGHWNSYDVAKAVIQLYAKHWPQLIVVEQAALQAIYQDWIWEEAKKMNYRLPLHGITPWADKVTRARSVTPLFERGEVLFPSNPDPNCKMLMEEMLLFPEANSPKDLTDATVYALSEINKIKISFPNMTDSRVYSQNYFAEAV